MKQADVRRVQVKSLGVKYLSALWLACALVLVSKPAVAAGLDQPPWVLQSRRAASDFAASLRTRLQAGLKQGPVAAIEVCHREAPQIALDVGARHGLSVRRTSVRVRNAANAPSAADEALLAVMAARLLAGEPASDIEIIEDRGSAGKRLAKPLVMEAVCLMCHGETLGPEVSAAIALRYPDDQATGFRLGELRGALLVESVIVESVIKE